MTINKTLLQNAEPKNGNVLWAQPVGDKLELKMYNKGKWSAVAGDSSSSSNDNQNTYRYSYYYGDYILDNVTGEHIPLWKAHKLTDRLVIPSGRTSVNFVLYLVGYADIYSEEDAADAIWYSTWMRMNENGDVMLVNFPYTQAQPVIS